MTEPNESNEDPSVSAQEYRQGVTGHYRNFQASHPAYAKINKFCYKSFLLVSICFIFYVVISFFVYDTRLINAVRFSLATITLSVFINGSLVWEKCHEEIMVDFLENFPEDQRNRVKKILLGR